MKLNQPITMWSDTDGKEHVLPSTIEICPDCEGAGKSSAYLGSFSGNRLAEAQADDEWWADYLAGRFDRECAGCEGTGRIRVVDEDRCDPKLLEEYWEGIREVRASREQQRQEMLFEGGWREEAWFDD